MISYFSISKNHHKSFFILYSSKPPIVIIYKPNTFFITKNLICLSTFIQNPFYHQLLEKPSECLVLS